MSERTEKNSVCFTTSGVLPLGTGNDLARVLGWGSVCDDDNQLPQLLEKYERATTKLLDRWSILTYEGKSLPDRECLFLTDSFASINYGRSTNGNLLICSRQVLCRCRENCLSRTHLSPKKSQRLHQKRQSGIGTNQFHVWKTR